jgi:hypothetical protein
MHSAGSGESTHFALSGHLVLSLFRVKHFRKVLNDGEAISGHGYRNSPRLGRAAGWTRGARGSARPDRRDVGGVDLVL